ncbi:MAG TPA: hypothetical protein VLE19_08545 [Pyrinomonadaceae bacterium]|nr:hypothetical protein [Pyrinomonadaceae bacterium]
MRAAEIYLATGDLNAAIAQSQRRSISIQTGITSGWCSLSRMSIQGKNAEALAEAEESVEMSKRLSLPLGVLGYVYGQTENKPRQWR